MILLNRVYLRGYEFDIFGSQLQERLKYGFHYSGYRRGWTTGGLGIKEVKIILEYPLFNEIKYICGKYKSIDMIKLYIHITKLNELLIPINYNKPKNPYNEFEKCIRNVMRPLNSYNRNVYRLYKSLVYIYNLFANNYEYYHKYIDTNINRHTYNMFKIIKYKKSYNNIGIYNGTIMFRLHHFINIALNSHDEVLFNRFLNSEIMNPIITAFKNLYYQ